MSSPPSFGWGETTTHYCFCRYDDCGYVTDDCETENGAYEDMMEHLEGEHGDVNV